MLGRFKDGSGAAALDDRTVIHDRDCVAHHAYDCESSEMKSTRARGLKVAEKVEDLGLDGDVEGGDGARRTQSDGG